MPYVASSDTYVPSRIAVAAVPARSVAACARGLKTDHSVSQGWVSGAQTRLVHNGFRPTAVLPLSAVATGEGVTHGAG